MPINNKVLLFFCLSITKSVILPNTTSDTVLCYNAKEHKIESLYFSPENLLKTFDYTNCSYGQEPGYSELNTSKPENVYNNSGFTDFIPAQSLFSVNTFPVRTAVKIFYFKNDSLLQQCSGTLIGRNLVLTALHCLCHLDSIYYRNIYYDSLYVSPAFDNGQEILEGSFGKKFYVFRSAFTTFIKKDIAVIELDKPLGDKYGWIGISYSDDMDFLRNNIFHKFSYPMRADLTDSTRIFNGDTLYYNYGSLDLITDKEIGYDIWGIQGQSGSSLFYTDNKDYYSFGVMNWTFQSRHTRITNSMFNSLKEIIYKVNSNIFDDIPVEKDFVMFNAYPNPFNPSTRISFYLPEESRVSMTLYDVLGNTVMNLVDDIRGAGRYTEIVDGTNLSSGIYICRIKADHFSKTQKLLLIK